MLLIAALVVFSLYAGRLLELQAVDGDAIASTVDAKRMRSAVLPAVRGDITDVNGVALATTVEARNITADQTLVVDPAAAARALAPVLGVDEQTLRERLTGTRRFVYVAKSVTPETAAKVAALGLSGVLSESTSKRVYPAAGVAANVVGFVRADGTGGGGLEYSLNQQLAGTPGSREYEVAGGTRKIPTGVETVTDPVAGSDVRLTIDRDIQFIAQQAIADRVRDARADSGTVIVMEPSTGRILAMATAPTFNPNTAASAPASLRGNRAVSDIFEPGSTSKVMTMAAVLEEGAATPDTRFTVPDRITRSDKTFHDHDDHPTLPLTLTGILAKSSNVGTIMASERITPDKLYTYLKRFGIGDSTGLGFPGEARGMLAPPAQWSGTSFPTIAFGQGLAVTSLQAASVFATIANDGVRVPPSLVAGWTDADGTTHDATPAPGVRVISAATARTVRAMMETVVSDEGTAAAASIPGYRVAGKTGTAQHVDRNCNCYRGYVASFIGLAPADAPRLVVAVNLTNPRNGHFGGVLGSPVFTRVMTFALQQLRVPPTGTVRPALKTTWN